MRLLIVTIILLLFFSCKHQIANNDTPVAQVYDNYLMSSEISSFIPKDTKKEDSILMAQSYVRNWITKELLLHKAIENLSNEEKDIRRQVEDYRTSLLIHQYKQKLIAQRLMDDINETEIEQYYNANMYNFILATPVAKAMFFILPKSATNLDKVRKWYKSDNAKDIESLEEYCITAAKKYDNFNDKWIELKYILNMMPGDPDQLEKELQSHKYLEKEDEENYYFLKIKESRKDQTIAPLGYVRDEIILIMKNKKKLLFETELERQINEEGARKNYAKIF